MKQVIDKTLAGARISVVVLAILALVVSGAGAAARLLIDPSDSDPTVDAYQPSTVATLDNKPDPEEAAGEMATGGRPWTEQSAYWQATSAWLGGTDQSRSRLSAAGPILAASCPTGPVWNDPVHATPYQIDHRLGHRFTLVGLKPSGTS